MRRTASPVRWARRRRLKAMCVAVSYCVIWHAAVQSGVAGGGGTCYLKCSAASLVHFVSSTRSAYTISTINCTWECSETVQGSYNSDQNARHGGASDAEHRGCNGSPDAHGVGQGSADPRPTPPLRPPLSTTTYQATTHYFVSSNLYPKKPF